MIRLTDDGTLDTVLECSECGEQLRYNFANSYPSPDGPSEYTRNLTNEVLYQNWVRQIIEDESQEHECYRIGD